MFFHAFFRKSSGQPTKDRLSASLVFALILQMPGLNHRGLGVSGLPGKGLFLFLFSHTFLLPERPGGSSICGRAMKYALRGFFLLRDMLAVDAAVDSGGLVGELEDLRQLLLGGTDAAGGVRQVRS